MGGLKKGDFEQEFQHPLAPLCTREVIHNTVHVPVHSTTWLVSVFMYMYVHVIHLTATKNGLTAFSVFPSILKQQTATDFTVNVEELTVESHF